MCANPGTKWACPITIPCRNQLTIKTLKIRPERSWYLPPIPYYTLRSLGGGGGERQRNQRGKPPLERGDREK